MKRQRALLEYALGGLRRRAGKHVAMTVGLAFVVGLYASALFLAESLREVWRTSLVATPDLVVQRLEGGRPALLDDETASALLDAETPGVRSIEKRVWGYLFVEAIAANVTVVSGEAADEALGEVAPPRAGTREVPRVVVGDALARLFGVHAGDRLAIPDARGELAVLEVAATFHDASALQTADVLLADETTARRLLALPEGRYTDVAVRLTREEEAPVIAAAVARALPEARIVDRRALARTYDLTFDGRSGLLAALFLPCLAALLLLAWDRLSGLGDAERREIGVLKAIGWETRDVIAARLWESAVVAIGGAWIGVLAAYVYVFFFHAPGLSEALFGWSALHPELELVPHVDGAQAWTLVGLVVLPFVGVSVVPAWRAATLDVDEAIR
ncbi:MAG: FtsX-like permease family protein [Sandaracinus sp.]|nr:FtsX-like permease family protein [Sandaracinus sp.]MCB9611180.1 FtsX-like permease family protein [Sandaracinus sp.]MCB9623733.1 FtsX-like permease family protein [Sandaracinus sp.]